MTRILLLQDGADTKAGDVIDMPPEVAASMIAEGAAREAPVRVTLAEPHGTNNAGETIGVLFHEAVDLVRRGIAAWHPDDNPDARAENAQPATSDNEAGTADPGGSATDAAPANESPRTETEAGGGDAGTHATD